MGDLEDRLRRAIDASVAGREPGMNVMDAVRRRHRRWLVKATGGSVLAISLIVLAALLTPHLLPGLLPGRPPPPAAPASSTPVPSASPSSHAAGPGCLRHAPARVSAVAARGPFSAPAAPDGVPPYYVALTLMPGGLCGDPPTQRTKAVVRSSATGAALATITPPKPYSTFAAITGAADDRTFVLAAQEQKTAWRGRTMTTVPTTAFFLLTLEPASGSAPVRLRLLPIMPLHAANVDDLALSPDGSTLAVSYFPVTARVRSPQARGAPFLSFFSVATGAQKTWNPGEIGTTYGPLAVSLQGSLSWTADGKTLGFVRHQNASGSVAIRLLHATSSGTNLLQASSFVAIPRSAIGGSVYPAVGHALIQATVTPDGRSILAVIATEHNKAAGHATQELAEFSAAGGKLLAVLDRAPVTGGSFERVLWTDFTGRVLVVARQLPGRDAGILAGGHFTRIPWSAQILVAAW